MKRAVCLFIAFIAAAAFAQQKRAFTLEDLYRVKGISDLAMSPDERTLVYTVSTTDLPRATRSTRIWAMNVDGSNVHALTQGDSDSSPHFSPDGKQIAFVREKDGDTNIFLLPLNGGEPRNATATTRATRKCPIDGAKESFMRTRPTRCCTATGRHGRTERSRTPGSPTR